MEIILKFPDSVPADQIDVKFLQGMLDRMAFGFYNYGPIRDNSNRNYDVMKSLRLRLSKYRKTKNTEFLIDSANFCMMEFMQPKYIGAKFTPTSRAESCGAVRMNGRISRGRED